MIIEEYDKSLFIQRFENLGRVGDNKNFSYRGLQVLFEYLDEAYDEENPLKLDVIGICGDFSEYENREEYLRDYPTELKKEDFDNEEDYLNEVEEEINENCTLIKFEDDLDEGFIISQY